MGWPGPRRRAVPLRLSEGEERPVRAIADAEHGGNLSEAIRSLLAEALATRGRAAERLSDEEFDEFLAAVRSCRGGGDPPTSEK